MKIKLLSVLVLGAALLGALAPLPANAQQNQSTIGSGGTELHLLKEGSATLVAGVATVPETAVTTASDIFVYRQVDAGTPGVTLKVTARTNGTGFTVTSKAADGTTTAASDTSRIAYLLLQR